MCSLMSVWINGWVNTGEAGDLRHHHAHYGVTVITRVSSSYILNIIAAALAKWGLNTLRLSQNGRHYPDIIFKCIFLNTNIRISINISLNIVPRGHIDNIPELVQIMACHLVGTKPLYEPLMVRLSTHICVTRPRWVDICRPEYIRVLLTYTRAECFSECHGYHQHCFEHGPMHCYSNFTEYFSPSPMLSCMT